MLVSSNLMLSTTAYSRHASNSMKIKLNSVKSVFTQFFTTITQLTFTNFFYFLSLNPFNHSFLTFIPSPSLLRSPPSLLRGSMIPMILFLNGSLRNPLKCLSLLISVIFILLFFYFFYFKLYFYIPSFP